MWGYMQKNMEIKKIAQMQQDEIFQENLELFLRNSELSKEVGWMEVENTDLLGRLNDYRENQRSLELFIKKLKEDEIDSCLGEISATSQLKESQKAVRSLERYNEYLKAMLRKYMSVGSRMSEILNGAGESSPHVWLGGESEDEFRESLNACLKMLVLLSVDVEEHTKYKDRYKQLRAENKELRERVGRLARVSPAKRTGVEVSVSIVEPGECSGEGVEEASPMDDALGTKEASEQAESSPAAGELGPEGPVIGGELDLGYELESLNYLVKQYKKENFELKQKIFEYEFNNTNLDLEAVVESELREKQRELDELEKEYSSWVIRLQGENSDLRRVIEIQEREQAEFVDGLTKKNADKVREMQDLQIKLVEDYEQKLREKNEDLRRLQSDNLRGAKDSVEVESLNKIVQSLEEKLVAISDEKHIIAAELERTAGHLKDTEQKLALSEETLRQKTREIGCLKADQDKTLEQYYHEKKLHQKFEQDAHSLRKELDHVLSDMYRNQKKSRPGISVEEGNKISSIENIIKHCRELEGKVDELSRELDQYKSGKPAPCSGSGANSAEIETLFDQVQSLRKEREQLKKDIRQRDWAKVEVEILHKRTTEEIDQIKRENTRLMLENLRLRDSHATQNSNNENKQANSARASIAESRRGSMCKDYADPTSEISEEGHPTSSKPGPRGSIQSILNLKAPRRPSLLIQQRSHHKEPLS